MELLRIKSWIFAEHFHSEYSSLFCKRQNRRILSFWIFEELWETKADKAERWERGSTSSLPKKKIKILKVIILCGLPQHLSWLTTQAVRKMIAEKLFHRKAEVLGSIAVTDCTWGLILSLLSQDRVPLKLMVNNLGIRVYMG